MQCCTMTLRRAIGLSIAVHVALFGSAMALAHYGRSLVPTEFRLIRVSLVGMGAGEHTARRSVLHPEPTRTLPEPAAVEVRAIVHGSVPLPAVETGETRTEEHVTPAEDADSAPSTEGASFGYSPKEWSLLQTALEKAKTYPRFARERGIEGTVLVRFRVQPTGGIERVDVVKSSGARILDDASVKTIYRAAPVPYVEGWVEVPMVYQLRGAGER